MNIIDIIILICFLIAGVNGLRKGFIAQVIAIISLVLGIWLSFKFATAASAWASQWVETSRQLLNIISFAVIFVVVVFGLFVIGKVLEKSIKLIMLGWLNRLLGVFFSLLYCALILGLIILIFNGINTKLGMISHETLSSSFLYYPLNNIANSVFPYLKELLFRPI
ncbi:MAG: CvpA family protein [Bacteroidales bacterium]|nr:CvpA family protein [Bacteroides sp.]MCM1198005.1 CvpA family protein [Clostridium sp.]MCM1501463.1 CvpA family protein [Bacteroidales bacterium]